MKRNLYIFLAAFALASCSAQLMEPGIRDGEYAQSADGSMTGEYMAIVTVKQAPDKTVYFQLNDSTTVFPRNYQTGFTRMERVICEAMVWTNTQDSPYPYTCDVEWIDSIEEGEVLTNTFHSDPIDVFDDWMTSVEDGFLTVHYNVWWGLTPIAHRFCVVTGTNPDDPYELVLKHDASGDAMEEKADGLVYFDINSLPSTEGQYKILTLKWNTLGGSASEKKFKFKTRE